MSLTSEVDRFPGPRSSARSVALRARRTTVLENTSQLGALSRLPFARTAGLGRLTLGGQLARHHRSDDWQRELNQHYHACGCDMGAHGLLVGLVTGGGVALLAGPWRWAQAAGIVLALTLVGMLAGKAVGLLHAQRQLRRTIDEITVAIRSREAKVIDEIGCG